MYILVYSYDKVWYDIVEALKIVFAFYLELSLAAFFFYYGFASYTGCVSYLS